MASEAMPLPRNPIRRKTLRRPRRSDRDPHSMNAVTEARLVAAAIIPMSERFPPRAYANSGISADVAPPATPRARYEYNQCDPSVRAIASRAREGGGAPAPTHFAAL